jgi:hypothetical protein
MPIKSGRDSIGSYFRWGRQTKYYFNPNSRRSVRSAHNKSMKQAQAIYSSGYH